MNLRRKSLIKKQLEKEQSKIEVHNKTDKNEALKRSKRCLRQNQTISYGEQAGEEESLKSPPSKRKCIVNNANRNDMSPRVVNYLEKLFHENKFIKDKQIEEISKEANLNSSKIREWLKQRSFKSNIENTNQITDRRRSRKNLDK